MLIVGLAAGVLAKIVMPGRQGGGVLLTMLLGIAGAVVAGLAGHALGWYRETDEGPGIIASAVGAFLILAIYGLLSRQRRGSSEKPI